MVYIKIIWWKWWVKLMGTPYLLFFLIRAFFWLFYYYWGLDWIIQLIILFQFLLVDIEKREYMQQLSTFDLTWLQINLNNRFLSYL